MYFLLKHNFSTVINFGFYGRPLYVAKWVWSQRVHIKRNQLCIRILWLGFGRKSIINHGAYVGWSKRTV